MSSYEDRCVKIGVVFHALYFENKVGDPPNFFHFCSLSMKRIYVVEVFRTNILKPQE